MSAWLKTDQPCPCGEGNSSYAVARDGHGFCFKCGTYFDNGAHKKASVIMTTQNIPGKVRGIDQDVLTFYSVKGRFENDGDLSAVVFPMPNGRALIRDMHTKAFVSEGEDNGSISLFGSDKFPAGSAKAITITEGYFDAMSAFQMNGKKYPVVGVQSASSAKSECAKAYDYINSFEKIYLALDADIPGQEAMDKIARLFDFNKVYVVKLDKSLKDANAYLTAGKEDAFIRAWWASQRFLPEGIVGSYAEFDSIIDNDNTKPAIPYPWERMQQLTYGIRTGEVVLLTAMEGIGKTEILRALEYHILKQTNDNIGIIHLEENKARTLKGIVNYEIKQPVHLPDFAVSKEDLKKHLRVATGRDERVHIYSHFGSDDPDVLLSTVRFLAGACDCKYIFFDHITMAVTGLQGEDERRALDYISTRLAMMVEELDFSLFMISHVNDDGKTRGSRNVSKVADLRVDLFRELTSENEIERNTTLLSVSKNRFTGRTGPGGRLYFNPETYVLEERFEGETSF